MRATTYFKILIPHPHLNSTCCHFELFLEFILGPHHNSQGSVRAANTIQYNFLSLTKSSVDIVVILLLLFILSTNCLLPSVALLHPNMPTQNEDSGRVDDEGRPILERVDLMEAFFAGVHRQI